VFSLAMRSLRSVLFVFAIIFVICTGLFAPMPGFPGAIAAESIGPDWSYQTEKGPTHWAELDDSFSLCGKGQSQSPIDLTAAEAADLVNPEFHYRAIPLNLLNNGHTVQIPYAPGSYLTLAGKQYNLLQFHFHSPSEHSVEGHSQAAELHLVHRNDAGELAVVAVMLQSGEASKTGGAYLELTRNLPEKAGDKVRTGKTISAQALLPETMTTYRYSGSLTTPPCTESVTWLVMSDPVVLPAGQIAKYEALLNHNNRPRQGLNSRSIMIDTSP
ncbi:MAG: carbonic anhydrase family protein, partial [Cyanobacteria bacterium J06623_5]